MILKLRYLTIFLDYILLLGAFVLAYFVRVGFILSSDFPFGPYFVSALIAAGVWVVSLIIFRGYTPNIRFSRVIHLLKVLIAGITSTAAFGLIFYFSEKELFSRLLLVYIFLFGTTLMMLFHLLMNLLEKRFIQKGYGNIRLLIIGSNRGVKAFISTLRRNVSPYVPVAILDGYGTSQKELEGVPILGKLNMLEQVVDEYGIDAVVQGDNIEQVANIVHFCHQQDLDYFLLPYLLGMYQENLKVQYMEKALITPDKPSAGHFWEKLLS
jgi:FlaA1/EpsC-like NDP-sugar epimerase